MGYMSDGLTFNALREANEKRMDEWAGNDRCTLEFRAIEIAGEVGELSEAILTVQCAAGRTLEQVKKFLRAQQGIAGNKGKISDVVLEMGDCLVSLDLLAQKLGVNMGDAARAAFNRTSDKYGLRTVIGTDNEWHYRDPIERG